MCIRDRLLMCGFWVKLFCLNEDLCLVDYRAFYEKKEDVFPTISMCLGNPFLETPLSKFGVNKSSYFDFLNGSLISEQLLAVDYDHVTLDISKYIKEYLFVWRNESYIYDNVGTNMPANRLVSKSFDGFYSFDIFYKCFALSIPEDQEIRKIGILFSNDVFMGGKRPIWHNLITMVHRPKQLLLSYSTHRSKWPKRTNTDLSLIHI